MTFRRLILLLLVLLPCMARGQGDCTPEPLPYFENFQSGFVHSNGQSASWWDEFYQEQQNCWTVCWVSAFEWRSLIVLAYPNGVQNKLMEIRTYSDYSYDRVSYRFAVSPHMAAAPRRLQFKVGYWVPDWDNINNGEDLILNEGARLVLGYVTDNSNCSNSFVPFDTLRIDSTSYYDGVLQSVDLDLGRYFDTFPQPWRIAFRAHLTESEDIHIGIDDIRISNEVPEYNCTEDYVDTICQGTGYYQHGFQILPQCTNDLGTRHYSYVDTTGCLVSLDLTVTGTHTTVLVDTVPCGQPSQYAPDTVLPAGTHYFYLTDHHGCDSLVVLTIVQAWVTHLYDTIMQGDTLLFHDNVLTMGGIYTHDTVASDGCDSLVVLHLHRLLLPAVNTDTIVFWFPNVFSPELEGNNRFGCVTNAQVTEFEMYIYHRWGQLVYSTRDIHDWWDGGGLPQGAYVYYYRLRTAADNRVHSGKGTVTLLR